MLALSQRITDKNHSLFTLKMRHYATFRIRIHSMSGMKIKYFSCLLVFAITTFCTSNILMNYL